MNRLVTNFTRRSSSIRFLHTSAAARAMAGLSRENLAELEKYSSCDISDALLKLKVPQAGFLPDLNTYGVPGHKPVIAPVSTVMFVPKGAEMQAAGDRPSNVPAGQHWADVTEPGTIAVLAQPEGQTNAVCGGIMALRMMMRGVGGIVVAGRVRDIDELRSTKLPISAYGTSTVGSGGSSVPWLLQVPVTVCGITVTPGDVAFQDPTNGVVIIPQDKVQQVVDMLPDMVAADERVKQDVLRGMTVAEAFKLHRGK